MAYVPQVGPQMRASVGEVASDFELDLDEVSSRPVQGLSGGMKQKLLVALALAARAELLILDEPTPSLDARNRARFFRRIGEQVRATVLLCSHRLEEIEHLVDQVVELKAGQVAFDGPVAAFLGARSMSALEVQAVNGHHADWLRGEGFHPGARGLWIKTVSRIDKMGLLGRLAERFDGSVSNVVARDLEMIDES